jgi:hypothetical protein
MPILRLLLESTVGWVLAVGLVHLSAYAAGVAPLVPSTFGHADSGHYVSIARSGYEFFSCAVMGNDPSQWCGNSGWFPGYPLMIRIVAALTVDYSAAGVIVSQAFFFGALLLLRLMLDDIAPQRENTTSFLTACVFPGGVYYHAIFPISMLIFFSLASLLLISRKQYLWASLASACGAFAYSTGFLLTGVVFFGLLATSDAPWPRRIVHAITYSAIAFSGFVAVLILHHITVGHWDAFFLTQAKYGHRVQNPLATYRDIAGQWLANRGTQEKFVPAVQTFAVGVIVVSMLVRFAVRLQHTVLLERLSAAQVLLFWIFPLIVGAATLTRAEANLLPLVLLSATLARPVQAVLLMLFAFLYFEVCVSYFKVVLV